MSPAVKSAADALADEVRAAPAIVALREAEQAAAANEASRQALERFQQLQLAFAQAQQQGGAPDADLLAELQQAQQQAQHDPQLTALAHAQQDAQALMPVLNEEISTVLGIDFSSLAGRGGCC